MSRITTCIIALTLFVTPATAADVFTYQGELRFQGQVVNDACDFQFRLYDAASAGTQIGVQVNHLNVPIAEGKITADLDFGIGVFDGTNRWIEIDVRCPAGSGNYITLIPRQKVQPSPYALFALAGNEGPVGPTGPDGPMGPQGNDGPTGPQGPQGLQGNDGPAGPQGPQGLQGNDGPAGPQGLQGDPGPQGPQGIQGNDGPTGPQGAQGPQGVQGNAGPPGVDGISFIWLGPWNNASNYLVNDAVGYGGSSYLAIAANVNAPPDVSPLSWELMAAEGATGPQGPDGPQGPQGNDGPAGPQGPQGPQGVQGNTGPAGPTGPQGNDGPAGPTGPQGAQGNTGPQGPAGADGSDALWQISGVNMYYNGGNIGVGTTSPVFPLHVESSSAQHDSPAVFGASSNTTAKVHGVRGDTWSPIDGSAGVVGLALAATGRTHGVFGRTNSPSGYAGYFQGPLGSTNYFEQHVGIGDLNPSHKLTVVSTDAETMRLIGPNGGAGFGARLNFGDADYAYIEEDIDDGIRIHADPTYGGRIALTGGNVGVGTDTPAARLHVVDSVTSPAPDFLRITNNNSGGSASMSFTTPSWSWRVGQNSPPDDPGFRNSFFIHDENRSVSRLVINTFGDVGIGTTRPTSRLDVVSDLVGDGATAINGYSTATSGYHIGVFGQSDSPRGRGVMGVADSATGSAAVGVHGKSISDTGVGVLGQATNGGSTNNYGVMGTSYRGVGVFGHALADGTNYGVLGASNSYDGYDFYAAGVGTDYGSASSRRWKSDIRNIDNPLKKIAQLRGVYYTWDKEHGGAHDLGMIAEEVGEVLPEIVQYEENGIDAIGMDYSKMTPLLVEAVNALRAEKDEELQSLRAEKDAEIDELTQRISDLERLVENLASNIRENTQ